ncbi:uncharacterized protein LOC143302137 isoform X1 [Babylonia areolata]|uniref:uncharacterized protein LOC143302137 isoform X1 n=1 Tax=Babylonia areolata TaxID=304850 RepID=UPI003FD1932D
MMGRLMSRLTALESQQLPDDPKTTSENPHREEMTRKAEAVKKALASSATPNTDQSSYGVGVAQSADSMSLAEHDYDVYEEDLEMAQSPYEAFVEEPVMAQSPYEAFVAEHAYDVYEDGL